MEMEVTTTYLEMISPEQFVPKDAAPDSAMVRQVEIPTPALNHFFFVNVGRPWKWHSRLKWTYPEWRNWAERKEVSTWIAYLKNSPVGYIELERQWAEVEISFLGLLPQFLGLGLGGFLLSEAVRIAWKFSPDRVWLHTCGLDHPYAMGNYLARGFIVFRTEKRLENIPDPDDPIWLTPAYYQSLPNPDLD